MDGLDAGKVLECRLPEVSGGLEGGRGSGAGRSAPVAVEAEKTRFSKEDPTGRSLGPREESRSQVPLSTIRRET